MDRHTVYAAKLDVESADCLGLPCQFILGEENPLITECNPHLLQIDQHGLSVGITAKF
jgi:hypothetical protein